MSEPITDLTAAWLDDVTSALSTITLNWVAASDVTSGSFYNIYMTTGSAWSLIDRHAPQALRTPGVSALSLGAPSTIHRYVFNTTSPSVIPSIGFKVTHVDVNGVESDGTSVSTYRPSKTTSIGAPHLKNSLGFDAFGQMLVNAQNSYTEIRDSVATFIGTLKGQRLTNPMYGIDDPTMGINIDTSKIVSALLHWEPRANVQIDVNVDDTGAAKLKVRLVSASGGI